MMQKSNQFLDYKTVRNSVILLFVIFLPFNYIHEVGHLAVCNQLGFQGEIGITMMYGYTICNGNANDSMLFRFMGGLLASVIGLSPLVLNKLRSKPFVCIALVSMGLTQFANALIETFAHDWYMNSRTEPTIMLSTLGFIVFIGLLLVFARKKKESRW